MTDGIIGFPGNQALNPFILSPLLLHWWGRRGFKVGWVAHSAQHHVLCSTEIGPQGQKDLRPIRWGILIRDSQVFYHSVRQKQI